MNFLIKLHAKPWSCDAEQDVTYPCADNWPGFKPFTQPEAIAMAKFITNNEITMYFAIHSYAQV